MKGLIANFASFAAIALARAGKVFYDTNAMVSDRNSRCDGRECSKPFV
jgi:hypothetical protein